MKDSTSRHIYAFSSPTLLIFNLNLLKHPRVKGYAGTACTCANRRTMRRQCGSLATRQEREKIPGKFAALHAKRQRRQDECRDGWDTIIECPWKPCACSELGEAHPDNDDHDDDHTKQLGCRRNRPGTQDQRRMPTNTASDAATKTRNRIDGTFILSGMTGQTTTCDT